MRFAVLGLGRSQSSPMAAAEGQLDGARPSPPKRRRTSLLFQKLKRPQQGSAKCLEVDIPVQASSDEQPLTPSSVTVTPQSTAESPQSTAEPMPVPRVHASGGSRGGDDGGDDSDEDGNDGGGGGRLGDDGGDAGRGRHIDAPLGGEQHAQPLPCADVP